MFGQDPKRLKSMQGVRCFPFVLPRQRYCSQKGLRHSNSLLDHKTKITKHFSTSFSTNESQLSLNIPFKGRSIHRDTCRPANDAFPSYSLSSGLSHRISLIPLPPFSRPGLEIISTDYSPPAPHQSCILVSCFPFHKGFCDVRLSLRCFPSKIMKMDPGDGF